MRKLLAGVFAVFALAGAANAQLILHVEDVIVNTAAGSGALELYLEETGGTNAVVSTYNVGVRLQPTGVVTFTGLAATQTHPSLFLGQTPTDRTANAAGYNAANDRLATDDFVISGNAADAPVQNGTRDGLFRLNFTFTPGALGVFNVNVDPLQFELADSQANPVVAVIDNGSITIVPEPATLSLLAVGAGLLAVRRRRSI